MSRPAPGTYYIVNKVLSPTGDKLAITFNNQGGAASLTALSNKPSQQWNVTNYNSSTMAFAPVSSPTLQTGWGSGVIVVIPAGAYVWTVKNTTNGTTIQDGGQTASWNAANATDGDKLAITPGTGGDRYTWIFVKVGDEPKPPKAENNIHIVSFKYTSTTSESAKMTVAQAFLALKTECISRSTGRPYIVSLQGGRNNSREGFDKGLEHVYVLEFATEDDRLYYLDKDPAHDKFKKLVGPYLDKPTGGDAFVFDYIPDVFAKQGTSTGPQALRMYQPLCSIPGSNIHVVALKYKSGTSETNKLLVAKAFLALKTESVSPSTGKPYIVSLTGGSNYSVEEADKNFEHAFVVEFATEADRQYFVNRDHAHDQFNDIFGPLTQGDGDRLVIDFVPGVFNRR
ncbi:hypothetical protein FRB94_014036 [Tulasnella sp. JGI-2019a]|nr:hypothetical protein FRB93_013981 [Tulasnella sp. JGI-2019a]KAG9007708.1 hypothetical protein FRB94_014036 [Tulasnella sp. JGI-2019a]KAG9034946.1 hypothetical protein FRB95_012362 [Tulasnella sp. JGI-2019a]